MYSENLYGFHFALSVISFEKYIGLGVYGTGIKSNVKTPSGFDRF